MHGYCHLSHSGMKSPNQLVASVNGGETIVTHKLSEGDQKVSKW